MNFVNRWFLQDIFFQLTSLSLHIFYSLLEISISKFVVFSYIQHNFYFFSLGSIWSIDSSAKLIADNFRNQHSTPLWEAGGFNTPKYCKCFYLRIQFLIQASNNPTTLTKMGLHPIEVRYFLNVIFIDISKMQCSR